MRIIDNYIVEKFLGTFLFIAGILSAIAVIIDISSKLGKIGDTGSSAGEALLQYYPFWAVWLINTFLPVAIFISVIYFTSRMTMQTEITAILSSGVSFFRMTFPFLIVGTGMAITGLAVNNYILPWANIQKNKYQYEHLLSGNDRREYYARQKISAQVSDSEFVFVQSYDRVQKAGNNFLYQRFDSKDSKILKEQISAISFNWNDIDSIYVLRSYHRRLVTDQQPDSLDNGGEFEKRMAVTPDEILPEGYVAETMSSPELKRFIDRQKFKGSASINVYQNELQLRNSLPFSTIILTVLGLAIASKKRRGGIGLNLALGVVVAFVYIFFGQVTSVFSERGIMSPFMAAWMPNLLFGAVAIWLYFKRAFS